MRKVQDSVYDKVDYVFVFLLPYLYFSCICYPTHNYTNEDVLYRYTMDNTQTATSKNHEGSVQGENTEVPTITGKGTCIEFNYKYTSIKVKSRTVFFLLFFFL